MAKNKKQAVEKKLSKKKKTNSSFDITKIYAPKRDEASTIGAELKKVTSSMSKEQVKKPRKIAFMVCFYVTLCVAVLIFCLIRFSKPRVVDTSENKYKEMYEELYREVYETSEILYVDKNETETESETAREIEKETETIKKIVETTKKEMETTNRAVETTRKEIETTKETVRTAIFNKSTAKPQAGIKESTKSNNLAIEKVLPKYDRELYSFATFYQYDKADLQQTYNYLGMYYDKIKDLVFGNGITQNDKGINGIIYLNYNNMKNFMTTINDTIRAKYIALADVQTSDQPLTFDFKNARDMDMYYEIPASDGKKKLSLMVLKKAKVGFSQSYNLTSTLEILDIECNTKHNPYFDIDDIVGESPKIKEKFKEQAYNLDDMLYTTRFNHIKYDKKGYITDIFYIQ